MSVWKDTQRKAMTEIEKKEEAIKKRLAKFLLSESARLSNEIAAYYQKYGANDVIEYKNMMLQLSDADKQLLYQRCNDFITKYPQYSHLKDVRESYYKLNRVGTKFLRNKLKFFRCIRRCCHP